MATEETNTEEQTTSNRRLDLATFLRRQKAQLMRRAADLAEDPTQDALSQRLGYLLEGYQEAIDVSKLPPVESRADGGK